MAGDWTHYPVSFPAPLLGFDQDSRIGDVVNGKLVLVVADVVPRVERDWLESEGVTRRRRPRLPGPARIAIYHRGRWSRIERCTDGSA